MNKLLTKIVGLSLGLSMAIGVGVAVAATGVKNAEPVEAATITTWTRVTSASTLTGGGTFIMGYEATANSGTIIPLRSDGANAKTTANGYFYTGTTSGSSTNGSITVTENESYSAYLVYITASTNTTGAINIQMVDSTGNFYGSSSTGSSKNTARLYTSGNSSETDILVGTPSNGQFALSVNVTGSYKYMTYNTGSPRYAFYSSNQQKTVFYKRGSQETTSPVISLSSSSGTIKKDGTTTSTITYSDLTSSLSATSNDTDVATVALANPVSSGSGTVVMTITGKGKGSTTIDVASSGATTQSYSVEVYLEQEFTKITKVAKIVDGGHYLIAKSGTSTIMSNTQNSNNRGTTSSTPAGASDFSTLTTKNNEAAVVVINACTGDDTGYYTIYDSDNNGYLYVATGGNYLRTGATVANNYYYWSISFSSDNAVFTNRGNSYVIRSNGALISAYASGQDPVDLYLLSSELVTDVNLSTITAADASVQEGSIITFSGTYTPTNATESIIATVDDETYATAGEVQMNNGTFTMSIHGLLEGSTTIDFAGEDSHGSASITVTVTAYAATHTKVTSTSGLYNGMKVILGNSEAGLVGSHHLGGNNMPAVAGSFGDGGSTLSNVAGTACEYTLWQLTIADSEENDVTGWAFYGDGNYLHCTTSTSSNYWKQTLELSSLCLFTITFSDGDASIVCADSHVTRGTLSVNTTNNVISAYDSASNAVNLYVKESSSEQAMAAGYEDFFLMMDLPDMESHGYCTSKHWYDFAKQEWNTTAFVNCRQYVSSDGKERLHDWAVANGDDYDGGNGALSAAVAPTIFDSITKDSTAVTVIVIISVLSVSAIGGFFFLRKRKEQ